MSGNGAFFWFVATTTVVTGLIVLGIFMAVDSYEPHHHRGIHLWHRHR